MHYNKAIKNSPDAAKFAGRAGTLLERSKNRYDRKVLEKALKDIDKAIENDPQNFKYFYTRSKIYKELDKDNKAMEDLNSAIKLNPQFTDGIIMLAKINKNAGNEEKACELFNKARSLGSKQAKYLLSSNCK